MKRLPRLLTILLALQATAPLLAADAPSTQPSGGPYLFSYFKNNGEDGLHLAWSRDGYTWKALKNDKSFLRPSVGENKLMRDPSLLQGPDGTFHLVWTTSWKGKTIGQASSTDLIHWQPQQAIPVMASEPGAGNCWAPELFYDAPKQQFLIVWSTSIKGKLDGQHRSYSITTKDFKSFTPATLFFNPGYMVIDDTIAEFAGRYYLIFKDERNIPEGKTLKIATGPSLEGPWSAPSKPFTRRMVEGPTFLKIGQDYIVYYDCFTEHHYGALKTRDFVTWEDVTSRLVMPKGIRHGTALPISETILTKLLEEK